MGGERQSRFEISGGPPTWAMNQTQMATEKAIPRMPSAKPNGVGCRHCRKRFEVSIGVTS